MSRPIIKVPSLIFSIEMEERQDSVDENVLDVIQQMETFLAPADAGEQRLMDDVRNNGLTDPISAASVLTGLGYNVAVRTALGGGGGADCLRNLRHSFVSCTLLGVSPLTRRRYIVDPRFKEQFVIAKPTSRYATILEAVPAAYVGPEEHLPPFVNFLCGELSAAFRAHNCVLPPWRQATSMLSKWKPRRSLDEPVGCSHNSTGGSSSRYSSQQQQQQQQQGGEENSRKYSRQDSGNGGVNSGSGKLRRSSIAAVPGSSNGQDYTDSAFRMALGGPSVTPASGATANGGSTIQPAAALGAGGAGYNALPNAPQRHNRDLGYDNMGPAGGAWAVGSAPGCGMSGRRGGNGFPGGFPGNWQAAPAGAGGGSAKQARKSAVQEPHQRIFSDFTAVPAS